MGNSESQTKISTSQCCACHNWFSTHELNQVQLCADDFHYISSLLKGEFLRGWSKKQISAFIVFICFGSYYLGKSSSDQLLIDKHEHNRKLTDRLQDVISNSNNSSQVCTICFEEYKEDRTQIAFGPCGHFSCNECTHSLQLCPFCRAEIEFTLPLFNN